MNENEFAEFESRNYVSPTLSRDEQLDFITTLRDTQAKNTAQINADTYALGSQLPSQLGGLSGAEDTFIARYQTPQTEQTVADLRTAAQQTALNQALSNLQNAYKKRYNDAILNYQKRAAASNNNGGSNLKGDTEFQGQDPTGSFSSSITGGYKNTATVMMPNGRQGIYALDSNGNIGKFLGYADEISTYAGVFENPVLSGMAGLAGLAQNIPLSNRQNKVSNTVAASGGILSPTALVTSGLGVTGR